jgi:tetratricopeptide (TPR) repeat protein
VVIIALLGLGGIAYALTNGGLEVLSLRRRSADREIVSRFSEAAYEEVITLSDVTLAEHAMDGIALVLGGFARFYEGVSQVTVEEKAGLIDQSIIFLRRARLLNETPLEAQVHYVLGKAYFHKGPFFADMTVQFLERALASGYQADDAYEYLGLAYAQLGDLERSASNFVIAAQRQPSDLLYLTVAQTYKELGDYQAAESYLRKAVEASEDDYMRYRARIELASVLTELKEFEAAEELLREILEGNPGSADAHYYLGVIYDSTGSPERARFQWREARRIDPNHVEALRRLGGN